MSLEFDSNINSWRSRQPVPPPWPSETPLRGGPKHRFPIISTEAGIEIDFSSRQSENVISAIVIRVEGDSNVTLLRDLRKRSSPSVAFSRI
jgi:hypothetical protein